MFGIVLVLIILLFFYFILIKPVTYWKQKGVPQYSVYRIWKNNLLAFLKPSPYDFQYIYNDFANFRYCGVYQYFNRALLIKDLELIKQITIKDFDHFVDHIHFIPENTEPIIEKNLFSLNGDRWKFMRNTLSPSFSSGKMKMMFHLMKDCANQFVDYFEKVTEDGQTVTLDMKDVFIRFANDVIASTAFGVTCNSLKDRENDFFIMGKNMTKQTASANLKMLILFASPWLGKLLGISMLSTAPKVFFQNTIKENIRMRDEKGIIRQDMIHLLMKARDNIAKNTENDAEFTLDDMIAQAFIFFFAGFDSVSTAMCFLAHELAVNPEIQERLQTEIDKTAEECNGSITYEAISKMKYLDMVVTESLRKWPPATLLDRICTKPYTIQPINNKEKAITLNKGEAVWISVYALHRDPVHFPNPDRFDPERFSDDNKSNLVSSSFLAFGSGPRTCIANRFAVIEMKSVFYHLLQKFDLIVVDKTTTPLKLCSVTLQLNVEGGFWLGLTRRNVK